MSSCDPPGTEFETSVFQMSQTWRRLAVSPVFLMLQGGCVSKREASFRTLMNCFSSTSGSVEVSLCWARAGGTGGLAPQSRAADAQSHCGTFVWI